MEQTKTAEAPAGLRELLTRTESADWSAESFAEIARAAFHDHKRREDLDRVLADWDSFASDLPGNKSDSKVLSGYLQFIKGDLESAEPLLRSEKSQPWGAYFYTRVLTASGKIDEALKVAEAGSEKHGDFLPLAYARVELLCRKGRTDEAGKLLQSLKKKDGKSAAWSFHEGLRLERGGEYRNAIESYREATSRDESYADAWFRLGFLLDLYGTRREDEADEAVKAYENCLKILPLHSNAIINLGLIYEDRERYHDAAKCYETVLRAYPDHPRAKLYLGDAVAATKMFYDREQEKKADRHSQVLKIPVTDFELSVRSRNCLQKMDIQTLGDLIMKTEQELLSYKNFGETSLKEIKDMLTQKGLRLGQGLEDKGKEPPTGRNPLEATAPSEVLDRPIEELSLSVRSRRCMERLEVRTVRDLINKTEVELMSAKNFGMTSLNEIKRKLAELGLALRS